MKWLDVFGMTQMADRSILMSAWLNVGICLEAQRRGRPMSTESQLRENLRKIEALFASAELAGELLAEKAALERTWARLAELGQRDPPVEVQCSMPAQWTKPSESAGHEGPSKARRSLEDEIVGISVSGSSSVGWGAVQ
jgi:hypothetical protein